MIWAAFLAALRAPTPPDGMRDALSRWPMLKAALATRPKMVQHSAGASRSCSEGEVDLSALPVQTHWPGDAGPLITWPVVVTRPHGSEAADVGRYNAGVYRAQVIGPRPASSCAGCRIAAARRITAAGQAAGEPMPVAIVLGADPATLLSAALPLPETVSELSFAGVLYGARPRLVPARTVPLMVPAEAEMVIEGWVSPDRDRARRPVWRPHRILQPGRAVSR